jgi:hypothetical protein
MPKRLEDNVRKAFLRASESKGSRQELVAAVRVLVRDLRNDGFPPEQVIALVKRLCGVTMIAIAADSDASTDASESRKISDMVFRAALEEYYSPQTTQPKLRTNPV